MSRVEWYTWAWCTAAGGRVLEACGQLEASTGRVSVRTIKRLFLFVLATNAEVAGTAHSSGLWHSLRSCYRVSRDAV